MHTRSGSDAFVRTPIDQRVSEHRLAIGEELGHSCVPREVAGHHCRQSAACEYVCVRAYACTCMRASDFADLLSALMSISSVFVIVLRMRLRNVLLMSACTALGSNPRIGTASCNGNADGVALLLRWGAECQHRTPYKQSSDDDAVRHCDFLAELFGRAAGAADEESRLLTDEERTVLQRRQRH